MELKPLFVFPRWSNKVVFGLIIVLLILPAYAGLLIPFALDPVTLNVGYQPVQPIPYSHALHVGQLGMDCRYCHNTVEKADFAAIPPTETCMNCHANIRPNSALLKPLRESYGKKLIAGDDPTKAGKAIPWIHVHQLPDYVYFNHSAHVNASISCVECHGQIDRMEVVSTVKPMNMGWCIQCHRDATGSLRPMDKITDLEWKPDLVEGPYKGLSLAEARQKMGEALKAEYHINPNVDCVTCHR